MYGCIDGIRNIIITIKGMNNNITYWQRGRDLDITSDDKNSRTVRMHDACLKHK